jgi:hypothetical protein
MSGDNEITSIKASGQSMYTLMLPVFAAAAVCTAFLVFFNDQILPDEFAGHMVVFRTFDKVSYALVMDSIRPTRVGYEVKHPDAPY